MDFEDYLNDETIEDVRTSNQILWKLKINDWCIFYFSFLTVAMGVIEYEIFIRYDRSDFRELYRSICLWISMMSTIFLLTGILFRYHIFLQWK